MSLVTCGLHLALRMLKPSDRNLVKIPFPLTVGFKSMMQRGIETQDMDVRWVSSLSWYFLNLFGLNGLFRLLLGSDNGENVPGSMCLFCSKPKWFHL